MTIYSVVCAHGCAPLHYTAMHRAEAGLELHYLATEHDSAIRTEGSGMNEAQAMEQINAALDKRFCGEASDFDTIAKIAQITGETE